MDSSGPFRPSKNRRGLLPTRPKADHSLISSSKKSLNVDSPSFTPIAMATSNPLTGSMISSRAAHAPAFMPRAAASGGLIAISFAVCTWKITFRELHAVRLKILTLKTRNCYSKYPFWRLCSIQSCPPYRFYFPKLWHCTLSRFLISYMEHLTGDTLEWGHVIRVTANPSYSHQWMGVCWILNT